MASYRNFLVHLMAMGMQTKNVTICLRADVHSTLRKVGKMNVSAYIAGVVAERSRLWRIALEFLRSEGWEKRDIVEIVQALRGYQQDFDSPRQEALARELEAMDVAELTVKRVRRSCDICTAIEILAGEWRLANQELETALSD